ncbi:hypothetical protein LCGC14_1399810 [marine sediment metagenome]|uniref:Uncharacterized protein n=1 Tax=marine sediment metagenome TaxID=412755 RepID=A0A0F9MCY8_9ZZZZ
MKFWPTGYERQLRAEVERLELQRFQVRVEQAGEPNTYHRYLVRCHGQDDAMLIAFALDGGWAAGIDATEMLELAKAYCDIEAAAAAGGGDE